MKNTRLVLVLGIWVLILPLIGSYVQNPGAVGTADGDLSGTYPNPTVAKINGGTVPASATALCSNGSSQPTACGTVGTGSIALVTGLSGGLIAYCGGSMTAAGFVPLGGGGARVTTESQVELGSPFAAVISGLSVVLNTAPGTSASYTFTLDKNGAGTALACTISGASATTCTDSSDTVSANQGDLLDWAITITGSPSSTPVIAAQFRTT